MSQFSSETHMQCEFFCRRNKIFKDKYFCGYEIYGENYKGIEYPCEYKGGKKKEEYKYIDFLLKNEPEDKLLIVELKNRKAMLGDLCQIYLYFVLLKEFQGKKISIIIISGDDSPDTSDIEKLKLAMFAKGKKMKWIERNELDFKEQIEKEYPEYKLEKEEKKVLLLKHKNKNELLVVCESDGYKGFGQISYLLGKQIKENKKYDKISGVIAIINGKKHEKELKLAIEKNEDTFANIDVKFMIWHKAKDEKDKEEFELILESNKLRQ